MSMDNTEILHEHAFPEQHRSLQSQEDPNAIPASLNSMNVVDNTNKGTKSKRITQPAYVCILQFQSNPHLLLLEQIFT